MRGITVLRSSPRLQQCFAFFSGLLFVQLWTAQSCTMVCVKYGNQTLGNQGLIEARSMEFSGREFLEAIYLLTTTPRNSTIVQTGFFSNPVVGENETEYPKISQYNKYGFIGIGFTNLSYPVIGQTIGDGMNEHGLAVGCQTFTTSIYQDNETLGEELSKPSLNFGELAPYVLGNFKNISEVKAALRAIRVIAGPLAKYPITFFHWSITDANGESIVVEYIKGKLHIYDNTVGTMTNDPNFDWHVQNLNNYVNIGPKAPEQYIPLVETDVGPVPIGSSHGFNLEGLPGSSTPASRFVKMFYLREISQYNVPTQTAEEAITLATALMNTVAIPYGSVAPMGQPLFEYTQWNVIKNHRDRTYMVRTYENMAWQKYDLNDLLNSGAFEAGAEQSFIHMFNGSNGIVDATSELLK